MNIYRARHDNFPESPVCTLYGRKGSLLLLPLDICLLQTLNGAEEFRPPPEPRRLIAAPIQEEGGGRLGLIAQYEWPPPPGRPVNPVVTVQLAPGAGASAGGIPDIRVFASEFAVGDRVVLELGEDNGSGDPTASTAGEVRMAGVIETLSGPHEYPDLMHRVKAYGVEFSRHVDRRAHGAAVRSETGELLGMLIATHNQSGGACRALVYPA
jgi:hypothetical protein